MASIIRLYESPKLLRRVLKNSEKAPIGRFMEVLAEAKARVALQRGQLVFVYLPTWKRYPGAVNHDMFFQREKALEVVRKLELPLIDFHQVLVEHADPLSIFPFHLHGHYNADGYRFVAKAIEPYLGRTEKQLQQLSYD